CGGSWSLRYLLRSNSETRCASLSSKESSPGEGAATRGPWAGRSALGGWSPSHPGVAQSGDGGLTTTDRPPWLGCVPIATAVWSFPVTAAGDTEPAADCW